MEAKLIEKLRQYSALRSGLLEVAFRFIPKNIVEQNSFFHSVLLFCATTVIVSIFATTRKLTLFSLHPICMTIGTILFLAEGIVSYRNDTLLEFLSPIMQHNKKTKVCTILYIIYSSYGALVMLFSFIRSGLFTKPCSWEDRCSSVWECCSSWPTSSSSNTA